MILKETLRDVVRAQQAELSSFDCGTEREDAAKLDLDMPFALVISGVRRCGKSTLLRQLMKKTKGFYYFNFEDPRAADFGAGDFQKLDEVFVEEFGKRDHYFFDEIQNAERWELFVRALLDRKRRVAITGSNASLLSKELGTRLTGRHLRHELFPFSFREFLAFTSKKPNQEAFGEYFAKGGFPDYLRYGRSEILRELLNDVISRDIVARHSLRSSKTMREMALYLLSNTGKEFSYNGLKKTFGLGSVNTAIAFVSYLEDSYLLFTVKRFDYSLKKQFVAPKKAYSVDNGFSAANSASFSADRGRALENQVFLHLRKKHGEGVFYFRDKNECDFLIRESGRIAEAVQVCYELDDDNKERELAGLEEALSRFKLSSGMLLTYGQEDELSVGGKTVFVKPVWKWLLE